MAGKYLPKTFKMTKKDDSRFKAQEQPNDEISVKILLTGSVSLSLRDLNRELRNDNMEASQDRKNKNAIVVQGIRPDDGYDAQNILTVVQRFDEGASITQ